MEAYKEFIELALRGASPLQAEEILRSNRTEILNTASRFK